MINENLPLNFLDDMKYVFQDEGGYAERAAEGGGAVMMGITFATFRIWRLTNGMPEPKWDDLKALQKPEALQIYWAQYGKQIHFLEMPIGADYCVLDSAVNNGITGAIRFLQEALGFKDAMIDGHYGLATSWAVRHRDPIKLVDAFCDVRLAHQKNFKLYKVPISDKSTKTWGQVWDSRVKLVRSRAKVLITEGGMGRS